MFTVKKRNFFFSTENIEKRKQVLPLKNNQDEEKCRQALVRNIPNITKAFEEGEDYYFLPNECSDLSKTEQRKRVFENVFGKGKFFTMQVYKNDSFTIGDYNFLTFSR